MTRNDFTNLCGWVNKNGDATFDQVLEFMNQESTEKSKTTDVQKSCTSCSNNCGKGVYPSECTDCLVDGEYQNYRLFEYFPDGRN